MTYSADRFWTELPEIDLDEIIYYLNTEDGTIWKGVPRPSYLWVTVIRDHREVREIIKEFCPLFRGFLLAQESGIPERV